MKEIKDAKGGRPLKDSSERLDRRVTVKFIELDYKGLKRRAKQANISLSEYIRSASMNAKIKPRLTQEENKAVRSLIGIATNLNQLARLANSRGMEMYRDDLLHMITTVKDIIYKYRL